MKNNKGFINKSLVIVFGILILGGVAGYNLYNEIKINKIYNDLKPELEELNKEYDENNCDTVYSSECENIKQKYDDLTDKMPLRTENFFSDKLAAGDDIKQETIDKSNTIKVNKNNYIEREAFLQKVRDQGFDLEYFPHGEIKSILDDGRILFEKNGLMVYDNGKITKSAHGDSVNKAAAIMNKDNLVVLDDIYRIKKNGDLEYFIGNKAVKRSTGTIWTYDSVGTGAMNNDKTLLAFEYRKPFEAFSGSSANTYLAIQKIEERDIIKFRIFDILEDSKSRKETIVELAKLNEEFESTIVLGVMRHMLPSIGTESVISASSMYNLAFNGKTRILDDMFGTNIRSKDKDKERNIIEYTFDRVYLEDATGKNFPNGEKYPDISRMCWINNDLYFHGVLDRDDKNMDKIYKITWTGKKIINRYVPREYILNEDKTMFRRWMLGCSPMQEIVYIYKRVDSATPDDEPEYSYTFEYLDINTGEIKHLCSFGDLEIFGYNAGTFYIKDKFNNNYILKLK